MTRKEAVAIALEAKKKWGGGSSEYWLVIALEALGVLKLEDSRADAHYADLPSDVRDLVSRLRLPVELHSNAEQTDAERQEAADLIERLASVSQANRGDT